MYKVRVLTLDDFDAVLSVFSSRFGDSYYLTSAGAISDDFKESVEYCLREGESRGVVEAKTGVLVGCALAFNYDVVPENVFCKLFGCSSYEELPSRGYIRRAVDRLWFVTYIVSVVVKPGYDNAVSTLLKFMRDEFGQGAIVSDTSDKGIYKAYLEAGYTGVGIGRDHFYVSYGKGVPLGK